MFNKKIGKGIMSLSGMCFTLVGLMCLVLLSSCVQEEAKMKDEVVGLKKETSTPVEFSITNKGKPIATIIIGEKATEVEKFAAEELQKYIKQISGATLPVKKDDEKVDGNLILIGDKQNNARIAQLGKEVKISSEYPGEDGFIIKTVGNKLILAGSKNRGTLYSVYAFLESLGCRWFSLFANQRDWEVIPQKEIISLGTLNIVEKPDFKWRTTWDNVLPNRCSSGVKNRLNLFETNIRIYQQLISSKSGETEISWNKDKIARNIEETKKRGVEWRLGSHSFYCWLPTEIYFDKHPEYYSLINGKRCRGNIRKKRYAHGTQYCFSNPAIAEEVAKNICNFFKQFPEVSYTSLMPNDFGNYCECDKCLKLENEKSWAPTPAKAMRSRGYLIFCNKVAEIVGRKYPDKKIDICLYHRLFKAPKDIVQVRNNIASAFFAIYFNDAARPLNSPQSTRNAYFNQELLKWREILGKRVTPSTYYPAPVDYKGFLFPQWEIIKEDMLYFKKLGFSSVSVVAGGRFTCLLNNYVCTKLLWNADLDLDEILNDFCSKSFGEASKPMRKYIDLLMKAMRNVGSSEYRPLGRNIVRLFNNESLTALEACLKEAKQLAGEDKAVLRRIADVEKEFLRTALFLRANEALRQGEDLLAEQKFKAALKSFDMAVNLFQKCSVVIRLRDRAWISEMIKKAKSYLVTTENLSKNSSLTNLAKNLSAEKFRKEEEKVVHKCKKDKKGNEHERRRVNPPVGWNCCHGEGSLRWGSSDEEAHSGRRSAFIEATKLYEREHSKTIGVALVLGNSRGYSGKNAWKTIPGQSYYVSFWIKGNHPKVFVQALGWNSEEAALKDRQYIHIKTITATSEWKQYSGVFTTKKDTRKFVLWFMLHNLGKIYVDDVCISPIKEKIALYYPEFDGGISSGCSAILKTLLAAQSFQPEFITDLSAKNLSQYKCLIFPEVKEMGKKYVNDKSFVKNIRDYVMKGGGVYFQHDSCGYKDHGWVLGNTTVFPEICKGVKVKTGTKGNKEGKRMIVNAIHPITKGYKVEDEGSHTYWDHMALLKGERGEVIVVDKNKDPVVIAGKVGKGKVVFDGTVPYDGKTEAEVDKITGIEKDILINSINWFCE